MASTSPHHDYLLQQMIMHAAVTGWSEHDHAICWSWRELSPEQKLEAEPTAMELFCPSAFCQEIHELYQDVYQLYWLPGRGEFEGGIKV